MKKININSLIRKISVVFPLAIFSIFLGYFAVDMPQGDDFELVLHFLTNYISAGNGYAKKVALLTAQFVEHRLFYTRIVILLQYLLTGQVSFYLIILVGNLSLLGILMVCWQQLKAAGYSLLYLFPVSLILFQPCYSYDGVLWPAATLAYNSVSFFAILTVHWLSTRRNLHFWLAVFCAMLCTYTFGNGVVVLIAGLIMLFVQKRWKACLLWVGLSVFITIIYFYDYTQIQSRNNPFKNITEHPFYVFANFLVFLGSALNWDDSWPKLLTINNLEPLIGGGVVLIIACYVFYHSFKSLFNSIRHSHSSISEFLLGGFTFFILTGLLLSLSRVNKDELLLHINRYRINSVVLLILGYLSLLPFLKQYRFSYKLFLGGLVGFWILSYFHFYAVFSEYKRTYLAGQFNWTNNHQWFIYRDTSYWEEASKMVMDTAQKQLQYRLSQSPFTHTRMKNEVIPTLKIEHLPAQQHLSVEASSSHLTPFASGKDYYLAFKNLNQSKVYLTNTSYNRRSIRYVLLGENYYYPLFHSSFTYKHFPEGKYQLGIAITEKNTLEIKWQPFTFDAIQESNITH